MRKLFLSIIGILAFSLTSMAQGDQGFIGQGRPLHPQTQGKIERYHRSMKNVVKLDNYFSPGQLEAKLKEFVRYYNNERYHESLNNLTPAEVYFGNGEKKLKQRQKTKMRTLNARKKQNQKTNVNL